MESDEVITMTCHRQATEEEIALAESFKKRPTSARGTTFSTVRSHPPASPRTTIQHHAPTNPRPQGSVPNRHSSGGGHDSDAGTKHCTS